MHPFTPLSSKQIDEYDKATAYIRQQLGSYEKIAKQIHGATGEEVSYQTIRDWFKERRVPEKYAAVLWDLTEEGFDLFALAPWLESYFIHIP